MNIKYGKITAENKLLEIHGSEDSDKLTATAVSIGQEGALEVTMGGGNDTVSISGKLDIKGTRHFLWARETTNLPQHVAALLAKASLKYGGSRKRHCLHEQQV